MRINNSWFQATMARDLLMSTPSLVLTPMLPLTPGMATTAMVDVGEDTEDTTDLTDTVEYNNAEAE